MTKVKVTVPLTTKRVVVGVTTMESVIGVDAVATTCAGVRFICGPQEVGPTRWFTQGLYAVYPEQPFCRICR